MGVSSAGSAAVALLALVIGACSASAPPPSSSGPGASAFIGPIWTAILVAAEPPVPGAAPTIRFTADHADGSGGCNQYGGPYRYDPATGAVTFDVLAMTMMACVDNHRMVVEAAFSGAVQAANHLALDPVEHLHLTGPGGEVIFARAPSAAPSA